TAEGRSGCARSRRALGPGVTRRCRGELGLLVVVVHDRVREPADRLARRVLVVVDHILAAVVPTARLRLALRSGRQASDERREQRGGDLDTDGRVVVVRDGELEQSATPDTPASDLDRLAIHLPVIETRCLVVAVLGLHVPSPSSLCRERVSRWLK